MTSKRDLGPILAAIGGVAILGAIIWGFIAVGGPGDARAKRLDGLLFRQIVQTANDAQCAFLADGKAPSSIEEAMASARRAEKTNKSSLCSGFDPFTVSVQGSSRTNVDYVRLDDSRVELCGDFRLPTSSKAVEENAYTSQFVFLELMKQRTKAGRYCYELDLARLPKHRDLAAFADTARLARCAYFVSGDTPTSVEESLRILESAPERTSMSGCGWTQEFTRHVGNRATLERLDASNIRVCGHIDDWSPLDNADEFSVVTEPDFTFPELTAVELSAGAQCFDIDITAVSAPRWGAPIRE